MTTGPSHLAQMMPPTMMDGVLLGDGIDSAAAWTATKALLERDVTPADFAAWLQPLELVRHEGTELILSVPTTFMQDWVQKHYREKLAEAWLAVSGQTVIVNFDVAPAWRPEELVKAVKPKNENKNESGQSADWLAGNPLDPRYTFASFVTGQSNQFAFAAAQRVADEMGAFNPFFLHGGVGLGKTHLMQAIGWSLKAKRPGVRIQYLSAEQFLYTFIRAIREKNTLGFKELFRNVDVLMIDDIQFIAGKEATQEEFFHTFNSLVAAGKQVILTADKSPHELANIEDRLRSRLGSGLAVEVHAPEVETRQAILEQKAAAMGLDLPHDVTTLLATNIASNVRELEGALNRLGAFAKLTGQPLTIAFAKEQLRDLLRVQVRVVGVEDIQKQVAEYFKIRVADMHAPRRDRAVARPRQVAMYLCKQLTTRSYPDIGRAFGGRDHTTVMHACQQIQNLLERDPQLVEHVNLLQQMLTAR